MSNHKSQNKIAETVIRKAGGVGRVAEITGASESWVHRWTYKKEAGGTDGEVPQKATKALIAAGVVIPSDFFAPAAQ